MKKEIATVFLTLATALGFAQEAEVAENELVVQHLVPVEVNTAPIAVEVKMVPTSGSFGYLRLGVADSQLPKPSDISVIPGLGLGYRFNYDSSAVDVSASANWRQFSIAGIKESSYNYTLPKAGWVYYISSASNTSFYVGPGVALSAIKDQAEADPFIGAVPSASVGVEMNRHGNYRSFLQFDVSQPIYDFNKAFSEQTPLRKAFAELSLGAGF